MIIYPAIDIIDGKCVRLTKGDYEQKKIYSNNLEGVAHNWIKSGSDYLHLVDLDGAKTGKPINIDDILKIRRTYPDIFIQVGGGIRDKQTIEKYISNGIDRVILGTKVLKDKKFVLSLDKKVKQSVAIDIAIKDGKLCGEGWEKTGEEDVESFVRYLEQNYINMFIITDISKDGMMQGINKNAIDTILSFVNSRAIISGGITTLGDVRKILKIEKNKIDGMIIGKALYEKKINLREAINECC